MRQIQNITDEPIQRHTILFEESEVVLTLRFFPKTEHWSFNAEYNDRTINGAKLSLGVLHMESQNQPFDFVVTDNSGNGIDPFRREDFSEGRCSLYMLEAADMLTIREGAEVPL